MKKLTLLTALCLLFSTFMMAQDDDFDEGGSVIQNLTPSKLIGKGQVDIKWFNNLFTQTRNANSEGDVSPVERGNFFTSTLDVFFGVSENRRVSVGGILEFRSNTIGGRGALDVFSFDGERGTARSGLTNIAPSVKFVPFENVNNFSVQSSFFISLIGDESDAEGVFLDQDGFTWQNRFFFDTPIGGSKDWQLFLDLNTELNFGDEEDSFANNSLRLIPAAFISYFPSSKFTIQGFVQHFQLISLSTFDIDNGQGGTTEVSGFEQDLSNVGLGAKYQLTDKLNIETIFSYFVRGNDSGLGESYNIGLRYVL